jgi:hypothetical protein
MGPGDADPCGSAGPGGPGCWSFEGLAARPVPSWHGRRARDEGRYSGVIRASRRCPNLLRARAYLYRHDHSFTRRHTEAFALSPTGTTGVRASEPLCARTCPPRRGRCCAASDNAWRQARPRRSGRAATVHDESSVMSRPGAAGCANEPERRCRYVSTLQDPLSSLFMTASSGRLRMVTRRFDGGRTGSTARRAGPGRPRRAGGTPNPPGVGGLRFPDGASRRRRALRAVVSARARDEESGRPTLPHASRRRACGRVVAGHVPSVSGALSTARGRHSTPPVRHPRGVRDGHSPARAPTLDGVVCER